MIIQKPAISNQFIGSFTSIVIPWSKQYNGTKRKSYRLHFFSSLFSTVVTTDSSAAKIQAHKNPSILMPDTSLSASIMMITLMTKRKSPSVIIVSGMVSMMSNGFTIKLRMPNTIAKMMAVVIELMATCGANNFESRYTTAAVISILIINFIKNFL